MDAGWRIELFAGLQAIQEDRIVTRFRTRKTGLLLAYLAYYPQRYHSRESLLELLWPGCEAQLGRNNLSKELTALRHLLEPPGVPAGAVLLADRFSVRLNPAAITTDVAQFEAALQAAARARSESEQRQQLADADSLYRGELLPGCFEDWALQERQRLAETHFQALSRLIAALEQAGDVQGALQWARRAVSADPLRDEGCRDLMRLLAACDEPEAALRQFRKLGKLLQQELGEAPEEDTCALARELGRRVSPAAGMPRKEQNQKSAVGRLRLRLRLRPTTAPDRYRNLNRNRHRPPAPLLSLSSLPGGTVTFLLAELAESATLRERLAAGFATLREKYQERLRPVFRGYGGLDLGAAGETLQFAFGRASDAQAAAAVGQQVLADLSWPAEVREPPVRMALHTGEVEPGQAILGSPTLSQATHVLLAAHRGQILLSESTVALLRQDPAAVPHLTDLGLYRLGSSTSPERLFQAGYPGMARQPFPAPNARPGPVGNLPPQFTRFFGRKEQIAYLVELLGRNHHGDTETRRRREEGGGEVEPLDRPIVAAGAISSSPSVSLCLRDEFPSLASARLITLTGPGGSGKTRLALEVAAQSVERFCGAVWFVPLVDIADPQRIVDQALVALGVPRSPDVEPLEQLVAVLSRQASLLLLDNFEQLVPEGAGLVQALLDRVPALTCLVTSRRRLNLAAEQESGVLPLPVPVGNGKSGYPRSGWIERPARTSLTDLSTLARCEAVQLFVDRAQAVRPDFQLTPSNAAAVAAVCEHLEGLPLAIELAAARSQVLTPRQVLAHLERRLDLLVSQRRSSHGRHRSLRATLDWSFQLLPALLQPFFVRLSVFRGGWTLQAAGQVCEQRQPLDQLQQLCECSLVLAEESDGEMRFRMLETMREYASEQLSPAEEAALQQRHAAYFLAFAQRGEDGLKGQDQREGWNQREWLDRLEREHDNFRAALAWCLKTVDSGQWLVASPPESPWGASPAVPALTPDHYPPTTPVEMGLLLAGTLQLFWQRRGYWREAQAWLERALGHAEGTRHTAAYAKVLCASGNLDWLQGNYAEARSRLTSSLAIADQLGDRQLRAYSLLILGATLDAEGEYAAACSSWEQCLPLYRVLGDQWAVATTLDHMAYARSCLGDEEAARALWQESVTLFRQLGDLQALTWHLDRLAKSALQEGDAVQARAYYEESLSMRRALRDQPQIMRSLLRLGDLASTTGDDPAARAYHEESLAIQRELGDKPDMLHSLSCLAKIALKHGDYDHVRMLAPERLALARELHDRPAIAQSLADAASVALWRGQAVRATRLLAAAQALSGCPQACPPPADPAGHERAVIAARAALGDAAFATVWTEGARITLEQAIASAIEGTS